MPHLFEGGVQLEQLLHAGQVADQRHPHVGDPRRPLDRLAQRRFRVQRPARGPLHVRQPELLAVVARVGGHGGDGQRRCALRVVIEERDLGPDPL